jgi:aminoglycoside phosphotransferase (APT) family kinase protein
MTYRLHRNEIPIDADLVRELIRDQFPVYAKMSLSMLDASGSTNKLFRLGDDLLVRLPRQPGGSAGIAKEHRWLPEIGRQLPVAVPEIVALGEPGCGYGERWSIVRWLSGELPAVCGPEDPPTAGRSALAADLAGVIVALRAIEVPEAAACDPTLRWYRGRPLLEFDEQTRANIRKCRSIEGLGVDLDTALAVWTDALNLPGAREVGADRWYHGDLVAENLLLADGRLTAVLDFGALAVGDPTIDLLAAWEVLDPPARQVFRTRLAVDDVEWQRGRAWALAIALTTFAYYWATMPKRCADRLAMARSVLADAI